MARKKQPTEADHLAYYAVHLLEITAEMRPYSRDDAWDIRTELLTVISRLRDVQAGLMDRIYKDKPDPMTKSRPRRSGQPERRH